MQNLVKFWSLILLTICSSSKGDDCPAQMFKCSNGKCLANIWVCDGDDDCGNLDDEKDCEHELVTTNLCLSSQFKCESDNHHCIPRKWQCDGDNDCNDGSDEKACDNVKTCTGFKCQDGHCLPNKWHCDGHKDCSNGEDEELCDHEKLCSDTEFTCSSGSCLNSSLVCNGENDCVDGSDEGMHCADICDNKTCSQHCEGTPTGPKCYCDDGFVLDKRDNKTCGDINECEEDGFCSHTCVNTEGSYRCICNSGYELVNRTCRASGSDPLLIYSTLKEVRGMKLRSKQYFPILNLNLESRITAVDVDPYSEKIYWIDVSNRSTIYSADLDGTGLNTVLGHGLLIPEDIAVDYLAHNVYLTDSGLKQILACKTDGKYCHVLHDTDVEKPRSIVLDMKNGLMYWSDWGHQSAGIYRSSMDGFNRIPLVSKLIGGAIGWPNGIALDPPTNRLYWADAKLNTIEFITLDHSRTRKVIMNSTFFHPYSLAVFEDTVYWSNWYSISLESCNKFTGEEVTIIARENSPHIMGIHVYHPVLAATDVSNPCRSNDCSHLCLRSAGRGYTCACTRGYKLVGDQKTCELEPHGAAIFVSEGSTIFQIRPKSVGSDALTELRLPLGNAVISRVAFDSRSRYLFVADIMKPAIYAVNMNSQEIHELAQNQVVLPADLAFDWTSNNLYWIDSSKGTAEVINVFFHKSVILLTNLHQPVSLAISPNSGHMFIASIGTRSVVKMYGMDGKNEKTLSSISGVTAALAVHPTKSLLYLADSQTSAILYVNYTTSRSAQILKSRIDGVMSLAVGEEDIYWTARKSELNILVGNVSFILQLPGERNYAVSLRVTYSQETTPGSPDWLCLIRNGGCSYVCLTSPSGRTCACPSDMMLSEDNVTCVAKPCNASDFKCMSGQCLKGEKKCDGVLDCEDGSDEINCTSRCSANDFQCKNGKCILKSWQCDFRNDCGDNSDESDCPKAANCTKDQVMCLNGECISILWRCDREPDCLDGSDESNCHATECSGQYVRCDNGQCVPMAWICDKTDDCSDKSDEKNCTKKDEVCTISEFRCESDGFCLDIVMRCNGRADCNDGSDEKNCKQHKDGCKSGMFVCKDSSCIYDYEVCDGHNDCSQKEDELNCTHTVCQPEEMLCPESKRCISRKWICDGDADCSDGSDEEGCAETTTRLSTLPPLSEGSCSKMNCQQKCRSTILGPRCYCNDSFELDVQDNRTCIDIDECLSMNICNGSKCINTNGSYTCACYDGFYHVYAGDCVSFDVKDSEFIFYNEGHRVYIIKLKDGDERIDLLQEFQRPITGLSFQPKTQILYISDEQPSIYAVNMSSLHIRILVKNNLSSPKDIEFDWMSNNLYWADTEKGSIEVISVDTLKRIVLIDSLSKPVSLAISPYRGNMFVSENGFQTRVSMYGMDGKNGRVLHSVQGFIMSLALHPSETLLYWSDQRQEIISSTNYTTEGSPLILRHIKGVMSVASSEDRIFYTADETSLQKDRGSSDGKVHVVELLGYGKDKSWKSITYSHGIKPSGKSECLIENGGCSYLCLTSPNGRTCACPTAMTLDKDARSCLGKQCAENDFRCSDGRCIPARMKCDGNSDCNDATDEEDCGSEPVSALETQ